MLHGMDNLAIKGMTLARFAETEEAANRQIAQALAIGLAMQIHQPGLDTVQADAGNARGHGREKFCHQRARQTKGFKIIAAPIGSDNRNAHLGHNFQQAILDSLAIIGDRL